MLSELNFCADRIALCSGPQIENATLAVPNSPSFLWRDQLKAKIDTGARSSALHAWNITPIEVDGAQWVAFEVHPLQRNNKVTVHCRAPLTAKRRVTSSSGHSEHRYVIETALRIGDRVYPVELSLTNRDAMGFRLLLGRTAIRGRFLVDAGRSYLVGNSQ
jgi:ribosomal protein S6--L-glutamate ligase